MGPDGMSVEVWKSLGQGGVDMLLDLLWRDSVIEPIFKENGGIQRIVGITDASR